MPITDVTDPEEMFRQAAASGATVGNMPFQVHEYPDYHLTIHPSDTVRDDPVPVVMLLLKRVPPSLPRLEELCARCARALAAPVGHCNFLAWNLPGFHWELHRDDEYEGYSSRVHLPLITTPQNRFVWAADVKTPWGQWLLDRHLERGRLYHVRTDVPHSVIDDHPSEARLHLILDVGAPALTARSGPS